MQGQRRAVGGISKDVGRRWRRGRDLEAAGERGGGIGEQRDPIRVEAPKGERVGQVRAAAVQLGGDGVPQSGPGAGQQHHPHPPTRVVQGQRGDQLGEHRQPPPLRVVDHDEQRLLLGHHRVGGMPGAQRCVALDGLRDSPSGPVAITGDVAGQAGFALPPGPGDQQHRQQRGVVVEPVLDALLFGGSGLVGHDPVLRVEQIAGLPAGPGVELGGSGRGGGEELQPVVGALEQDHHVTGGGPDLNVVATDRGPNHRLARYRSRRRIFTSSGHDGGLYAHSGRVRSECCRHRSWSDRRPARPRPRHRRGLQRSFDGRATP